jgi:anhydro-N-acetylmuramic acid kinase
MGSYLGLISGTSMDAIDAALVDFDAAPLRVLAATATPYDPGLKTRVSALIDRPERAALDEIGQIDVEIGRAFGAAANALLRLAGVARDAVSGIGSHGQTLRHRIDLPTPFTWQIGDPNCIAEATGLTVVADFRRRDVAAGGQGAPLVPIFHDRVFRSDEEDRVIANVGGIANITVLRRNIPVFGFDTGPGNRLLDAWIAREQGQSLDRDGAWAAGGRCDAGLLEALRDEPYLRLPPPKSTGRELFNLDWLERRLLGVRLDPRDVQATLLEFTAVTIGEAVGAHAPDSAVYVCGGGAHNAALLAALRRQPGVGRVASTAALGVDPDYVEAIAFAWFARQTLAGIATGSPSVTGAAASRILGGIYAAG